MNLYFTPEEIARVLRVSAETVRQKLRRGELAGVRFGRSWRIPRREALRLLGPETVAAIEEASRRNSAPNESAVPDRGSTLPEDDLRQLLARHQDELRQKFGVRVLGIFGSYARGEAGPTSDVDLLIELERPLGWELVDVKTYLEGLLGRRVDLITLGALRKRPRLKRAIQENLLRV